MFYTKLRLATTRAALQIGMAGAMSLCLLRGMVCLLAILCLMTAQRTVLAQTGTYLVHTATAANTNGNTTFINDPNLNGQSGQILMVTQDWSGFSVYNNHAIGVYYN